MNDVATPLLVFLVGIIIGGMEIGGYLGAHIALKKGEQFIKRLFVIVVIASGIKLLLF